MRCRDMEDEVLFERVCKVKYSLGECFKGEVSFRMGKSIACRDAGSPCSWTATAATPIELLSKIADHAKTVHPNYTMQDLGKVMAAIKDT